MILSLLQPVRTVSINLWLTHHDLNNAPMVTEISTGGGVRRSTPVCTQPKLQYIPAHGGKKYSYATTALGRKMLDDVEFCYNPGVAFSFIQQLSLMAALREWGNYVKVAGEKEINQLH